MTTLLEAAAEPKALQAAWRDISDRGDDAEPGRSITKFAEHADQRIQELSEALRSGSYRPAPLFRVEIPKSSGGTRTLDVPPVPDRVVERAVLQVITPLVDPWLSPAAMGYRPGLGTVDAIQRVVRQRDEGLTWALRSDIDECFPTLPRDVAVGRLLELLPDRSLDALIAAFTTRRTMVHGKPREVPGIPQGTSLSPLLCNLTLVDFDSALVDRGFALTRFADDFVVACSTREEAVEALTVARHALEELGMSLEDSKTEIMDFATGFAFIGEEFGPRYPPVLADHRVDEPSTRVVYVAKQGARVRIKAGRLLVATKDDEPILDLPSSFVRRIVLFGSVSLSAGARSWALSQEVETVFLSRKGNYLGLQISSAAPSRTTRLRRQFAVVDDPSLAMPCVRTAIQSKIRHQVTLIQRFASRDTADAVRPHLELMRAMRDLAPDSATAQELMGVEGAAARAYFEAIAEQLPEPLRLAVQMAAHAP
jgi:CRISPR-associated protein Cas1